MFSQEHRNVRLLFTRSPIMSIAAVLALAIGIAGNSAMFSIVSAVLLKPLPYPHPDRIVALFSEIRSKPGLFGSVSVADFRDWQARSKTLEAWAIYFPVEGSVVIDGQPVTLRDAYISNGLVQTTQTEPLLGSLDPPGTPENSAHVYISERLWRERLHSDARIIGKSLTVEGVPRTVRAVLPAGFNIGFAHWEGFLWIPTPPPAATGRADHIVLCIARLRPEATPRQAQKEMSAIADDLSRQYPTSNGDFGVKLFTLQQSLTESESAPLWTLLAAVLLVQLIVCTNVASLLLSRAAERAQQTAIRIALGASLSDIARQCLAEGLALAFCGGIIGLLLGRGVLALGLILRSQLPVTSPIVFDWRVAGFAFALSLVTGVLASLAPWWQARFIQGGELLKEGSRSTASVQRRRLLRLFAGVEIAVSLVLLAGAGLLIDYLSSRQRLDLGFDPNHLYSVRLIVPINREISKPELSALYDRLLARVNAEPGLHDASLISLLTPDWGNNEWLFPEGKRDPRTEHEFVEDRTISPGYFRLMKVPFLAGHIPNASDLANSEQPAILNDFAAREYWPKGNALGSRFKLGEVDGPWYRVTGIVRDYRNAGPTLPVRPELYSLYPGHTEHHMYLAVRSTLPQARIADVLRRAVLATDPTISFSAVESMNERNGQSIWVLRFVTVLLAVFSIFSMLLAVVGVYSVMSYSVSQRTTEIGIRLAVGADPFRTVQMIVRDGLRLAAVAASIGILIAISLAIAFVSHHVGDNGLELKALPLIGAYFLILIFATAACLLPARRAALVDPMLALRPDSPQSLRTTLRSLLAAPRRVIRSALRHRTAQRNLDLAWIRSLSESMDQAGSVREVLVDGVARLRETIHAECAALFVRGDEGDLRCEAADSVPEPAGVRCLAGDSFVARRLRGLKHAIAFDERDLAAWEHFAAQSDPETRARRTAEIATLRAANSSLLVPVWLKGELLAVLSFGSRREEYDDTDIAATEGAATQLAFLIENGRLMERVAAGERTRQELVLAARFQRRLFPEKPLYAAQIELAGECQPARSIGGDYYDFLELPNGQIGIALADVAGKGIAAALLTSIIQASVRSLAPDQGRPLAALVKRINDLLYQSTEAASYATFFYAQFDPIGCHLKFVNAGHNPPYFLHARNGSPQTIRELPAGGPIIGLLPIVSFEEQEIDLRSGDLLVAYTDGIVEALNAAEEEYGEERLQELVRGLIDKSADEIRVAILDDVRVFIDAAAQYDDMTVLVMKVK